MKRARGLPKSTSKPYHSCILQSIVQEPVLQMYKQVTMPLFGRSPTLTGTCQAWSHLLDMAFSSECRRARLNSPTQHNTTFETLLTLHRPLLLSPRLAKHFDLFWTHQHRKWSKIILFFLLDVLILSLGSPDFHKFRLLPTITFKLQ